jgi:hypothetical protein
MALRAFLDPQEAVCGDLWILNSRVQECAAEYMKNGEIV